MNVLTHFEQILSFNTTNLNKFDILHLELKLLKNRMVPFGFKHTCPQINDFWSQRPIMATLTLPSLERSL